MSDIFKPERLSIRQHAEITEKVIQDIIANDPSIIGLGDLIVKDKERIQPRAGRLDLLLMDPETTRRYEVEIQLGKTDESHIIRTLEYWDIEKRRYPQYDHCAVIIAEDITSRFLNVIRLFNGFLPLIALQMTAYKFGDKVALTFTKVLDEMPLGLIDDDEDEDLVGKADREYWIKRSSKEVIEISEDIANISNEIEPGHSLDYFKSRVNVQKNGEIIPYLILRPRKKNHVLLVLKLERDTELDSYIEAAHLDCLAYNVRDSKYRIRISANDIETKRDAIRKIIKYAKDKYES